MVSAAGPSLRALNCSQCGGSLSLRAPGQSQSLRCNFCGSVLDLTASHFPKIGQIASSVQPLLALGSRIVMDETRWELLGFVVRSSSPEISWQEHLFFNPYQGYRWLTEFDGHWSWVRLLKERVESEEGQTITHRGRTFRYFETSEAQVTAVVGEFYWRLEVGERTRTRDFISPPFILSQEIALGTQEISWSFGVYVPQPEIQKILDAATVAEGVVSDRPTGQVFLPYSVGIAVNQPAWLEGFLPRMIWPALSGTLILVGLNWVTRSELVSNLGFALFLWLGPLGVLKIYQMQFEARRRETHLPDDPLTRTSFWLDD